MIIDKIDKYLNEEKVFLEKGSFNWIQYSIKDDYDNINNDLKYLNWQLSTDIYSKVLTKKGTVFSLHDNNNKPHVVCIYEFERKRLHVLPPHKDIPTLNSKYMEYINLLLSKLKPRVREINSLTLNYTNVSYNANKNEIEERKNIQ